MTVASSGPSESTKVALAVAFLRQRLGAERCQALKLGIVLGSGLKDFAKVLEAPLSVPFADVPHWIAPKVEGHGGALVVGRVGATMVACLTGRVHLYEGHQPVDVVRAVRTLRQIGVPAFFLALRMAYFGLSRREPSGA